MYRDEFGNVWASKEDYLAYLKEQEKDDNDNILKELLTNFTKVNKIKESDQDNE